jgi:hypothetical protein
MRAAVVNPNRLVFALALNADDSSPASSSRRANGRCSTWRGRSSRSPARRGAEGWGLEPGTAESARRGRGCLAGIRSRALTALLRGSGCAGAALARRSLARDDRHEIVVRDRIFVLLTQEMLFDQGVEVRWSRVCELALKEANCVYVLLSAKDQLRLLLALHHLLPHWHGDCQEDCHHAQGDQQNGHGVTLLAVALAMLATGAMFVARRSEVFQFVQSTEIVSWAKLFLTT